MSGGTKVIQLTKPFAWFDRTIERVSVKEPTGFQYMRHGDPQILIRIDGGAYMHDREEIIARYIGECMATDDGKPFEAGGEAALMVMGLADIMSVKVALLDFFSEAQRAAFERKSSG